MGVFQDSADENDALLCDSEWQLFLICTRPAQAALRNKTTRCVVFGVWRSCMTSWRLSVAVRCSTPAFSAIWRRLVVVCSHIQ